MSTLIIDILLIYNSDKNRARSEIYFAKLSLSDAFLKRYSKKLYNKASETHNNNKKYKQMLAFYHFALEVKIRNGLLICSDKSKAFVFTVVSKTRYFYESTTRKINKSLETRKVTAQHGKYTC